MTPAVIFSLEHVRFAYAGGRVIFPDLSLALHEGERVGLHGGNGEGKTTLFRLITGLERPQAGRVLLGGRVMEQERDFAAMRRAVGLVLQEADDQLFCPTVLEDVSFGPLNLGLPREAAREKARSVLRGLGLAGFEDRLTHRLSGGEKKLVSLAGVLAMEPAALLLDEPTAALDARAAARLKEVLDALPMARITVSHDMGFLEAVSNALWRLEDGRIHKEPLTKAGQLSRECPVAS